MEGQSRPRELGDDPRVLQILSTEHWSLLSARSLAYNEAFTRASMFLTFVSMSFVGLALLATATGFTSDFLLIGAVVLGFDLVIGLVTFLRVGACNREDTIAVQSMNRIRHAYLELAPQVGPYFSSGTNDDYPGIMKSYMVAPGESDSALATVAYGLSTSLGLVGLVMAILGGLFGGVIALAFGTGTLGALAVGAIAGVVVLVALVGYAYRGALRVLATLEVRFPSPQPSELGDLGGPRTGS